MSVFDFNFETLTQDGVYILLAGRSGTGKTTALRGLFRQVFLGKDEYGRDQWSAPIAREQGEGVIVISAEKGLLSIRDLIIPHEHEGVKDFRFARAVPVTTPETMDKLFEILMNEETKKAYRYIMYDGLTEASAIGYKFVRDNQTQDGLKYNRQYESYRYFMQNLLTRFRDLPHYHKIMTISTTPSTVNNADTDYGISFELYCNNQKNAPNDSIDHIKGFFDCCLELRPEIVDQDGNRMFLAAPTSPYMIGKDRSGQLLPEEPYNLEDIIIKMRKDY